MYFLLIMVFARQPTPLRVIANPESYPVVIALPHYDGVRTCVIIPKYDVCDVSLQRDGSPVVRVIGCARVCTTRTCARTHTHTHTV